MTEGQELLLIFALLYLSECLVWTRPGEWVFLSGWWGGRWRADAPAKTSGKRRIALAQPLPPLGWGFDAYGTDADPERVREKVAAFADATVNVRWAAAWLVFPWFFLAIPLSYWREGASLHFFLLLLLGWVLLALTAVLFFRAHRRLHPTRRAERWQHTILAALVPQHAMRCPGVIARPLLAAHDPLAVAAAVLTRGDFARAVSQPWRRLCFPAPGQPVDEAGKSRLEPLLLAAGVAPADLTAPPAATADAAAYCPCCHALFQDPAATCRECDDRPVAPVVR